MPKLDLTTDPKKIEKQYYDRSASLSIVDDSNLSSHGPAVVHEHLRAPYLAYQAAIEQATTSGSIVVDLGAGTGTNSFLAAPNARLIVATDISEASLDIARARARSLGRDLLLFASDAEQLPLRPQSIDICTSAGVLYCLDVPRVLAEVSRVLKPDGVWVIVDSFNHSPIYRLNRLIGYWRGRRTRRAYTSIPDDATLELVRRRFSFVTIGYFGVWSFLWPVLRRLLGQQRALRLLSALEPPTLLRRYAFKIVVVARCPLV
jgi:ubiquinone/menaquinone biosynthesis C-methylase UbiE